MLVVLGKGIGDGGGDECLENQGGTVDTGNTSRNVGTEASP